MGGTLAEIESEAKDKFIEKFISIAYTGEEYTMNMKGMQRLS